jgi:hypothetical protein
MSLSQVLPYADMAIVDSNMAERIGRLRIDKRFGVRALPASSKGLAEAAAWLEQLQGSAEVPTEATRTA